HGRKLFSGIFLCRGGVDFFWDGGHVFFVVGPAAGNACLPSCGWCCVRARPRQRAELGFKAVILPLSADGAAYCVRM
ncbi:MAG: hypothetical protein RSF79_18730, partial [Janthinobacterium sp.]